MKKFLPFLILSLLSFSIAMAEDLRWKKFDYNEDGIPQWEERRDFYYEVFPPRVDELNVDLRAGDVTPDWKGWVESMDLKHHPVPTTMDKDQLDRVIDAKISEMLIGDVDVNADKKISSSEIKDTSDWIRSDLSDSGIELDARTLDQEAIQSRLFPVPEPEVAPFDLFGLRIRREYEPTTFLSEIQSAKKRKKAFDSADPAIFTFLDDRQGNQDIWAAQGVIAKPIDFSSSLNFVEELVVVPSFAFNRVTGTSGSLSETDSHEFRLATVAGIPGAGIFDYQILSAGIRYGEESGAGSEFVAAELDWEPVILRPSIGGSYLRIPGPLPLLYRSRFVGHVEYGEQVNLTESEFFRFGPVTELALRFDPNAAIPSVAKRLSLSLDYSYLWGAKGEPNATALFEIQGNFQLDEVGHFNLTTIYQVGEIAPLFTESEYIQIGLGIKF